MNPMEYMKSRTVSASSSELSRACSGSIDYSNTFRSSFREHSGDFPEDFLDTSSPTPPTAPQPVNGTMVMNTDPYYNGSSETGDDAASVENAADYNSQSVSVARKRVGKTPVELDGVDPETTLADYMAQHVFSTMDKNDPLNAEIDSGVYIDTAHICKTITEDLKKYSIPQAIFAKRVLCRSQGTLSDLLRNPKPWGELKSGRATFRRMYNWLMEPLSVRLSLLDMDEEENKKTSNRSTPAEERAPKKRPTGPKTRLVFTEVQRRTLAAVYKETKRPSREMQETIADHLHLPLSTVANYFMNQRRRERTRIARQNEVRPAYVEPIRPRNTQNIQQAEEQEDESYIL